jgi:tRNA 2-thiouridine synthesizing protein A
MSDDTRVDARGLLCPLPVIRLQDRAKSMVHGGELTLLATDPGVLKDVPAWCRVHGHDVVRSTTLGRDFELVVRIRARD